MNEMSGKPMYSMVGLSIVAVLLLAVIAVSDNLLRGVRLDLTENRLYTLSEGTHAILSKLDEPINLYFYYSEEIGQGIPSISNYAKRVREMLEEMSEVSAGKLKLTFINPEPFSDEEDRAVQQGIQSVPLGSGNETLYFGLAASNAVGDDASIPFFSTERQSLLEYDLSKLIYQLGQNKKPVVGLLSTLNMGGGFDARRMQATSAWMVLEQLRQFFEIQDLVKDIEVVPEGVDVLVLVHPAGLGESTLYAIDQFVVGGGNALIFVDPLSESAQASMPSGQPNATQSNLEPLFETWGIRLKENEILGDAQYALKVSFDPTKVPTHHYAMLGVRTQGMSQDDVITRGLERVNIGFGGILEPLEGATTQFVPLVSSSKMAMPISTLRIQPGTSPTELQRDFNPTGNSYALAARLSGMVHSAYPEGKPVREPGESEQDESEDKQEVDSKQQEPESREHLKQSKGTINIVVIADTDLLTDRLWVQLQEFFGQRVAAPFADNADLVINAVDNLLGSADLISIRSRASYSRPFDRVDMLRLEAESRFRAKEQELQARLQETEIKINELQIKRGEGGSALVLGAEQQDAIEGFQQDLLKTRKELRNVRHELNKSIENLGTFLKFINIVFLPLLLSVILFSIIKLHRKRINATLSIGGKT